MPCHEGGGQRTTLCTSVCIVPLVVFPAHVGLADQHTSGESPVSAFRLPTGTVELNMCGSWGLNSRDTCFSHWAISPSLWWRERQSELSLTIRAGAKVNMVAFLKPQRKLGDEHRSFRDQKNTSFLIAVAHSYKVKQEIHFRCYSYKRAAAGIILKHALLFSRLNKREMTDRNKPLSMISRNKVRRQSPHLGSQALSPFLSSLALGGKAGIWCRLSHWDLNTLFLPTCLLLALLKRAD